jgi:hypothetical protein
MTQVIAAAPHAAKVNSPRTPPLQRSAHGRRHHRTLAEAKPFA